MGGYEIGLSGLQAAQNALDVIGNNIANAATEGYHRQEVNLNPTEEVYLNGVLIGQGVEFEGISRLIDQLLEDEIIRQESSLSQISRELEALMTMESAFAELTTSALSSAMDEFFNSMRELSTNPKDVNLQRLVISGAESLANQLRCLGTIVATLEDQTYTEAQDAIERVNLLASQIAELNERIRTYEVTGETTSNLLDQRDELIAELGQLVGIKTYAREYNVVDVLVGDTALVMETQASELEVGLVVNGDNYDLGIRAVGADMYSTSLTGGVLGGLFSLRNEIIRGVSSKLDTLAQKVINETNKYHVQGVGSAGSFISLTGWAMTTSSLSDFVPPVTDGTIYVRVIAPDGTVTRYDIPVDASEGGDTLTSIMNKFAAIEGLDDNTCINAGKLQIVADSGYSFDFLPGVLSSPSSYVPDPLAGAGGGADEAAPTIDISGLYTGSINQTYTCTVSTTPAGGTMSVGSGTMIVEVQNGSAVTIATINIGEGYVPGTIVEIEEGMKISFGPNGISPGYFNDGDVFTISALSNSDTSGFLAAAGINCFFSGVDATSMGVCGDISNSGARIAASRGVEMTDSRNALLMAGIGDAAMSELDGLTLKEYYRKLATDIGNQISVMQMRHDNTQGVLRNLSNQRDAASGVDINEEATKMLVFERMFQAMAKYINVISDTLDTVITIIE
jgi:flagellar hook-associated protein 1 FlgK